MVGIPSFGQSNAGTLAEPAIVVAPRATQKPQTLASKWRQPTPREKLFSQLQEKGTIVAAVPPHGRGDFTPGRSARPTDSLQRSAELGALALWKAAGDRPRDLSETVRDLAPTCPTSRKLPLNARRMALETGAGEHTEDSRAVVPTPPSTPRRPQTCIEQEVDLEAADALEKQRAARLWPYMQVQARYVKHTGDKAEATGTLMSGWGVPSRASTARHGSSPKGVRRPKAPAPDQPKYDETAKLQDPEQFVTVLIHGHERLIPRAWVTPLGKKQIWS